MGRYTAILDACVLYPAQLRDLLLSMARTDEGLVDQLDDVGVRALAEQYPMLAELQRAAVGR